MELHTFLDKVAFTSTMTVFILRVIQVASSLIFILSHGSQKKGLVYSRFKVFKIDSFFGSFQTHFHDILASY